ncbi:glycyl-tRNA synthetase beta chain [Pelagirhabdus alkalitolerans]|uniref:Glycine--tRNA ligase beta subunit n=1 Tax=Pelagirhabdus alkalitolerans TaxID=1612202 RepID=A0A1G6HW64_9BACI|nr:glycine--tRNA ligase subunit beta [Pelagirhabdus alkalitolerans]SDB98549.1 glycyl-tRNA synthetase beta chain [Pelagirhabdus alkalitolerans]
MTHNVLFEVGLEDMPARFLKSTESQFLNKTKTWLDEQRLTYHSVESFITPRRFSVLIKDLSEKQPDLHEEVKGPAKKIALDESGNWTKAAIGFAKGQGADVDAIYFKEIKGEDYVHVEKFIEGQRADEILQNFKDVILSLTFPKNMRWSDRSLRFIRPIKWLLALKDDEVIPFEIEGVQTSNQSFGHRFLGSTFTLSSPTEYEEKLETEWVIANSDKRKKLIMEQLNHLETSHNWVIPVDDDLLEEVTQLVEYPTAFYGQFSDDFLEVPEEALVTSMKEHQRYFPVRDQNNRLLSYFIGVRNGNEDYLDTVAKGNEKVLNARLKDAVFFYQEDQKQTIDDYNQKLSRMVFQENLGTIKDKVDRITNLTEQIAKSLSLNETDINDAVRTAEICKFDLVTQMVNEFTNLQGIMGEKYARLFGESEAVAKGINEHYMPKHTNDALPNSTIGSIVSVADKLDTIVGCISVGLVPSGSQDPYALRRQTMGVIRILKEENWSLSFEALIDLVLEQLTEVNKESHDSEITLAVKRFFESRISYLAKEEKISQDIIRSVSHRNLGVVSQLFAKAHLLENKRTDEAFKPTQEALVRVMNLAKKGDSVQIDETQFENEYENNLFNRIEAVQQPISDAYDKEDYQDVLNQLTLLTDDINAFFDHTMVMADDSNVRSNRLAMLNRIAEMINPLADFTLIEWKQQF